MLFRSEQILNKKENTYHCSTIYEYSQHLQSKYAFNPKNLKPIDLTVPEMTQEEKKIALAWQRVEEIREAFNGIHDPFQVLNNIRELVKLLNFGITVVSGLKPYLLLGIFVMVNVLQPMAL